MIKQPSRFQKSESKNKNRVNMKRIAMLLFSLTMLLFVMSVPVAYSGEHANAPPGMEMVLIMNHVNANVVLDVPAAYRQSEGSSQFYTILPCNVPESLNSLNQSTILKMYCKAAGNQRMNENNILVKRVSWGDMNKFPTIIEGLVVLSLF